MEWAAEVGAGGCEWCGGGSQELQQAHAKGPPHTPLLVTCCWSTSPPHTPTCAVLLAACALAAGGWGWLLLLLPLPLPLLLLLGQPGGALAGCALPFWRPPVSHGVTAKLSAATSVASEFSVSKPTTGRCSALPSPPQPHGLHRWCAGGRLLQLVQLQLHVVEPARGNGGRRCAGLAGACQSGGGRSAV